MAVMSVVAVFIIKGREIIIIIYFIINSQKKTAIAATGAIYLTNGGF